MSSAFSSRLPLSRGALDRDHLSRAGGPEALLGDPDARVVVLRDGEALTAAGRLLLLAPDLVAAVPAPAVYLGRTLTVEPDAPRGAPVLLATVDEDAGVAIIARLAEVGTTAEWGDLRRLGHRLSDRDAGIFTEALAIANWHTAYGFAPRSGRATELRMSGWVRVDAETGTEFFPRTDAAIIVGVVDADDRILLGSNALWPAGRFSLLAGFVEPGESLEAAVIREVHEESGITVADPRYLGSQPWPFPASLMVGFTARVADGATVDTRPDGEEIVELRWWSREELARDVAAGELTLPGRTSIARAILEEWYGGEIHDEVEW